MSMPGYVEKALNRFAHTHPTKPEDSPHHAESIIYAQKNNTQKTMTQPIHSMKKE